MPRPMMPMPIKPRHRAFGITTVSPASIASDSAGASESMSSFIIRRKSRLPVIKGEKKKRKKSVT